MASSRPPRDPNAPPCVLITGICGRLGTLTALHLRDRFRVLGLDRRQPRTPLEGVVHHAYDIRSKRTRDVFRAHPIDAVIHLGVMHDRKASDQELHSWNIVGFQKLLDNVERYGVGKLIVLSSADVYGALPDNPQFLGEEAPLLGAQSYGKLRDLVELDMLAQSFFWKHPRTETVVLRPCNIVGKVQNGPSNYLRLARPIRVLGYDPMVQMLSEHDVVRALTLALGAGHRGIFNLRGPGELPLSRILARLRAKPLWLPPVGTVTASRAMARTGWMPFPPEQINHLRYPCTVDGARARKELGFRAEHEIDEILAGI